MIAEPATTSNKKSQSLVLIGRGGGTALASKQRAARARRLAVRLSMPRAQRRLRTAHLSQHLGHKAHHQRHQRGYSGLRLTRQRLEQRHYRRSYRFGRGAGTIDQAADKGGKQPPAHKRPVHNALLGDGKHGDLKQRLTRCDQCPRYKHKKQ
jgi:hypothetical protein